MSFIRSLAINTESTMWLQRVQGLLIFSTLAASLGIGGAPLANAQSVTSVAPIGLRPGETSKLTVHGAALNDSLRLLSSIPGSEITNESVEATKGIVQFKVPADIQQGPTGIWVTAANGLLKEQTLLIDGLPLTIDTGKNHTPETAQAIPVLAAVQGVCEPARSDFYQLTVAENQRLAFEVHTQPLLSTMDPVVRLLDAAGKTLHLADDGGSGPDCRFEYTFATAGDYRIEISDSRHKAAGAAYYLRVGDFPVLTAPFPMVVQAGQEASIGLLGQAPEVMEMHPLSVPPDTMQPLNVSLRLKDGKSAAWGSVAVSEHPQKIEAAVAEPLSFPVGLNGHLAAEGEVDEYMVTGKKGQAIRIRSRTRSLGLPTRLVMQLQNAAGAKVAETKVTEADEWSFDYTFAEDGDYKLVVNDLLKRGGAEFGYWFEIIPAGTFSITLKPDAKTRDSFAIQTEHGACAIDLTIDRFGYDGEIDLSLATPVEGLRVLNPRIPAKAAEYRVYVVAEPNWTADQIVNLNLLATNVQTPTQQRLVESRSLQRVKSPAILSPPSWRNGRVFLTGTAKTDAPFALEPASPALFARPLKSHSAVFTLKRLQEGFKEGVTILGTSLPSGWNLAAAADKDTYTVTLTDASPDAADVAALPLLVFGESGGHGQIVSANLPITWIDPLSASLEFLEPVIRGGKAKARVQVKREGSDPQPVTITLLEPSPGIQGPASIVIAADQTQAELELAIAADAGAALTVKLHAASKYAGQDFAIDSQPIAIPAIDAPTQIAVFPGKVELKDRRSHQRLVVSGMKSNQTPRDWTRLARMTVANPEIAFLEGGVLYPKSDGQTEVIVEVGGTKQVVPVTVVQASVDRPVAFESEALVALSKQGCNSGACHGSPSGKGGFRLSLRAFDIKLDELTLIREDFGRRVHTLDPAESLLLLKPMMSVAHGGGKQLRKTDAAYQVLHDWIAGGAQVDPPNTPRVERLEIYPNEKQVLAVADGGQQLAVTAHFADGTTRDVTELASYETSDTSVATVDVNGFVTPQQRGEIAILVRFLEHIESLPLMFVEQNDSFAWAAPTPNNYIDELVNAKLMQLQYQPSETCSDAEYLRRVSLDLIGSLPTVERTKAFLADTSPDKREKLVDELLEREEYAKFWALKWGDLLRMTSKLVGEEGVHKYHRWVEESLQENMPYDEFAKQLLTGSGSTLANPPANFYRTATDMNECVETISQVFLGARLQCAKCHNHPFERWTQDNYYGLGAFFTRVQRRKTERPGEMFVYARSDGEVTQPRTGEVMKPWLPQRGSLEAEGDQDRRDAFAEWLVEPNNPYFARIEANRIWSQLFARGIVDPIDDFRDSNPPANSLLLDALEKDFVESGYDRKHLLRAIARSRTYQASYRTNEFNGPDEKYFSHQQPRLLGAEQLLDAINQTLGLSQTYGTLPAGTLATQLPAPDVVKVDFLKTFGQPERSTVCACERAEDSNLGMAIELFNGPMMHKKLRDPKNRFRVALAAGKSLEETITELYVAAVCRPPEEVELKAALAHCAKVEDPASGVEDVCWALFNTDEFLFQH
ncbi:Bacterial Ig-like domain (group 2) [Roseimaritima multifibrata]|uniref:Bacterial Ig-like domain (Group 2) n=2 Tax=Roseimaritima multifibrata TaxID=1930274 RepID=A0A517MLI0_9BACT|nr:Bacterial Ig-like domain (group 2) [Roseimaritima multifibrata]